MRSVRAAGFVFPFCLGLTCHDYLIMVPIEKPATVEFWKKQGKKN